MPQRVKPDEARIRELHAKGLTEAQIAARLGVSVRAVTRAIQGGRR